MTQRDWGVLVDRELWPNMTPTERDRSRREAVLSGGHNDAAAGS